MDKNIEKALNTLKIEWISDEDCTIEAIESRLEDDKQSLIDMKSELQNCKDLIEEINQLIPEIEENIISHENILHQINVEEYKELNKDMDVEIF